ncbi:MAG: matrixin family metalloprotease [Alphaproteobacteria bacterium]|nr:matrixin family metalloprotease [Alphaproteobacteria bacterium]
MEASGATEERFWSTKFQDSNGDGLTTVNVVWGSGWTVTQKSAIRTAWDQWEDVAAIDYVETGSAENTLYINRGFIDDVGSILAYATWDKEIVFDVWDLGWFDLQRVALHELGHVNGLDHVTGFNSSMQPYYNAMADAPTSYDINSMVTLYGPAGDTSTPIGPIARYGGQGDQNMAGGADADILYGNQGNDTLAGNGGEDTLFGGQGRDQLSGGSAGDVLYGNKFEDTLYGGEGTDFLYGGQGSDTLYGGGGDLLFGNLDGDLFVLETGQSSILDFNYDAGDRISGSVRSITDGAAGAVVTVSDGGSAVLVGQSVSSVSSSWFTGGEAPTPPISWVGTGFSHDYKVGTSGDDTLNGRFGNDTLSGGAGDDIIGGSYGDDQLWGGSGADTFGAFNSATDLDVIHDFEVGVDRIDLGSFWSSSYSIQQDGSDTVIKPYEHGDAVVRLIGVSSDQWGGVTVGNYGLDVY